ncbi:MAG: DUF1330 domain-containing protein [Rubrimonas sp.]|uniref:DUF1330 domain-containing protein n=1 Tax=Rubrimonas sp. TaxID=2036015 RepID=UPI002FDE80EB
MAKGYVIARIDVDDPEAYALYTARTPEAIAAFGGRFLVRGGAQRAAEGAARGRQVVIEFPDYAAACAFYDSDAYRAILPFAWAASTRDLVLVEGFDG